MCGRVPRGMTAKTKLLLQSMLWNFVMVVLGMIAFEFALKELKLGLYRSVLAYVVVAVVFTGIRVVCISRRERRKKMLSGGLETES